ncbi:carboxypeptidase-like regulatory domain-containing protein [Acidobacterium sp. S8]|uniref:carboxypeptidase-like regulatory domain-containing protein n=1 Tax=Acidobacterium sp. S8 TaxID=1641854 RepID=UPI00131D2318|nr:carboxypeptidase-like regulatory domain-containing protein [Acidobacterium sp. S8]
MRETNSSLTFWVRALCLAALLFAVTLPSRAQYSSGIEGAVTDPSGAVVPGAQVILTNQETQVKQIATANGQGFMQILHIPPGRYTVTVSATGFNTWVQKDLDIEGTDVRTIYPKLNVGAAQSTVEVTANSSAVETTSGTISRTLEQQTVQAAPLVGENLYASVATLAPGVTGLGGSFGGASGSGSQGTNSFNAEPGFQIIGAGQRQESNEYQVDGTSVNGNSRDGITNLTPEPDSVAQLKISTDVFSADKGRQSGTLIEVFTKPGTDHFHGTLSEFYTGSALTARTEFQTTVPRYIRNDFGGSIGGPIRRDRTFFFGELFWSKSSQGVTLTQPMETPEFVNYVTTNFPNSLAAAFFKGAPSGGVPTSGFQTVSQIEQNLISPYPIPDIPGDLVALGNVSINQSPINNGFQGHVRIDHNFRDGNDKIFYSLFRNTTEGGVANARPELAYVSPNATWYNKIDYVHTFSPTVLNEASMSYVRADGNQPAAPGTLPSLPNVYPGGLGEGFGSWGPSGWVHNNWNWHDVLTYVKGTHSIRVGIDVDRQQDLDNFTAGLDRPTFYFTNIVDFAVDHPNYQSGPVVDVHAGGTAQSLYSRVLMLQTAPFVQDDWKVTNKLTLNVGLRWDYFGHLGTVTYGPNPLALFTPGSGSTIEEQVGNGSMPVRGSNGKVVDNALWRFAPRFGFAYDVFGNGTTSVHGGWGLYNNKIGDLSYVDAIRTNPPQFADPSISIYNEGTTLANFSYGTSSSGPTGFAPPPGIKYEVDDHGGLVGTRIGVGGPQPNLVPPLVQNWSIGIQRSIGSSVVVEADYFGTSATHLYFQTDSNRFAGDLIVNNGNLARLNSSFGSVIYGQSIGVANAEVAAFAISKRFSRGWSVHAIYNYGKALDYTSSNDNGVGGAENVIDVNNPARNYGRADYDARHRISIDAVWNIPGLHGGVQGFVTNGWMVSPVIVLESGQPFTVYTSASFPSGDYNGDGFNYDVPNVPSFGSNKSTERSDFLEGVFPASAFPLPALGTEGNLGRNTYNGPGLANVNLAASRTFKLPFIGDQGGLQIRGEILNLFNRVNLTNPVSDLSNGEFGKSTDQNLPRNIQVSGKIRF